jgi:hypothetical protein
MTLVLEGHNEAIIGIDEINVGLTWATVVRKQNSIVSATTDLYVGSNTPNNSLVLGSGTSTYRNTYIGFQSESSNNQLLIGGGSRQSYATSYHPIDLSPYANTSLNNLAIPYPRSFPYGASTLLGGIPFNISATGNNVWHSMTAAGGNVESLMGDNGQQVSMTIPMNISASIGFYTLINSYWGQDSNQGSFSTIRFQFSDGTGFTRQLYGNIDIRDYNNPLISAITGTINGITTVNVFQSGSSNNHVRPSLDRQYYDFAAAGFAGKTLTSVTLTDSGGGSFQRVFLAGATAVSSRADYELTNGLIAYYPLQGNGNDLSDRGNNATVNNATPTTDRFGNSNGALFFNGTNAYLEAAHQQYLNTLPITISCWFSRADTNSKGTLVGRYVNQSWNGYHLSYGDLSGTNSVIPFYARNYGNDISDGYDSTGENPLYFSKPITDTNWHLATMTVDTSGSTLYIDGVADTNHAWRGAPMVTTTTTPLKIGAQLDPSGQQTAFHFHGSLSDVRIYNRALGSNEVAGLYGQTADGNRVTTDTFGSGSNQFSIDFVTVGNPGNSNDTTGYGGVPYEYLIGKYTISQNQIDVATRNGLQNVTAGAWSGDQPAAPMQWFEAAAYVNWLNTSQGYRPAYNLTFTNGAWSMALWPTTLDNNGNVA